MVMAMWKCEHVGGLALSQDGNSIWNFNIAIGTTKLSQRTGNPATSIRGKHEQCHHLPPPSIEVQTIKPSPVQCQPACLHALENRPEEAQYAISVFDVLVSITKRLQPGMNSIDVMKIRYLHSL